MDIAETVKTDAPKLPDMVMCGDHPSVNRTEPGADRRPSDERERERKPTRTHSKVFAPTASQAERPPSSEHALRAARPRAPARDLLHAALGSARWPPYLLAVWLCVVLLTHALHCAAALLERALPAARAACAYSRSWTEASWASGAEGGLRVRPLLLALCTALLYVLYGALAAALAAVLWAVEPLSVDGDAPPDEPDPLDAGDLDAPRKP